MIRVLRRLPLLGLTAVAVVAALVVGTRGEAALPSRKAAALKILIAGVPARLAVSVELRGPMGYRVRLTKPVLVAGLSPGRYRVLVARVLTPVSLYVPVFAKRTMHLRRGTVVTLRVRYRRTRPAAVAPAHPTLPGGGGASGGSSAGDGTPGGSGGSGGAPPSGGQSAAATTTTSRSAASGGAVNVFFGYADTYRPTGSGLPSPWEGDPDVIFVGCGNRAIDNPGADKCPKDAAGHEKYDAGAIRLDNGTAAAITVSDASVQIGACIYVPWPGLKASIQPGQTLILTQTGGPPPCGDGEAGYNFDTSESAPRGSCANDNLIPVLTMSINGTRTAIPDSGQILNTGGNDRSECHGQNEARQWVPAS